MPNMERMQAYKFELRPDGAQRRLMRQFAGCCRYVYNWALALQEARYERGDKKLGYAGLCKELTAWREEARWLEAAHSQILQQALKDLERAYRNFFEGRAAFPRGGRWFVSIQTRRETVAEARPATSPVGIDMGVVRFATLSDGAVYEPLGSFKRHQRRLAHYQRMMGRRCKGGKNWQKARRKVQKAYARIGNCRRDYLHKVSTAISKNHAMVCIGHVDTRQRRTARPRRSSAALSADTARTPIWSGRQCLGAGAPRCSLWRNFARPRGVGPGTHRSESV